MKLIPQRFLISIKHTVEFNVISNHTRLRATEESLTRHICNATLRWWGPARTGQDSTPHIWLSAHAPTSSELPPVWTSHWWLRSGPCCWWLVSRVATVCRIEKEKQSINERLKDKTLCFNQDHYSWNKATVPCAVTWIWLCSSDPEAAAILRQKGLQSGLQKHQTFAQCSKCISDNLLHLTVNTLIIVESKLTFLTQTLPAPLVGRCNESVGSASAPSWGSRKCPLSQSSYH